MYLYSTKSSIRSLLNNNPKTSKSHSQKTFIVGTILSFGETRNTPKHVIPCYSAMTWENFKFRYVRLPIVRILRSSSCSVTTQ